MTNPENETRFFKMLSLAPDLKRFWDESEGVAKLKTIQIDLAGVKKDESMLLRFFVAVWFSTSSLSDFDFIEAMKIMNKSERSIIRKWMVEPFFCGDFA